MSGADTIDLQKRAISIIEQLRIATAQMTKPASLLITQKFGKDPYLVLVGCILSLRTRDKDSWPASCRLFQLAQNPEDMLKCSVEDIQKAIYPVGFYRRKTQSILQISSILLDEFDGKVPKTQEQLMRLPGVGLKTANLVLAEGFDIPALIVDTHVHRISNRLGLIKTKTPEETEKALKELLPKEYWIDYSRLLVTWGQNICVPISPFCSQCAIFDLCKRVGVTRSR